MEKLTANDIKKRQLDMLKYIDKICRAENINYFINYGTLLGSVRHKGFIPWDDDVDISMLREDYEKFKNLIVQKENTKYQLLDASNSDWYFNNFMVLLDNDTVIPDHFKKDKHDTALFIDIFPVDTFNDKSIIKKIRIYNFLISIVHLKLKYVTHNKYYMQVIKKIIHILLYFIKPKFFANKINTIIKQYHNPNGKYQAFLGMGEEKEIFKTGLFDETIDIAFENLRVKAPKHYDIILKQLYGDYMQLPPETERYGKHEIEVYKKQLG